MKSYDVSRDLKRIRLFFEKSQEDFANELGISRSNVLRIENNQIYPHASAIENIYTYAYERGLNLNLEKSRFFVEEQNDQVVLYHGAKDDIEGDIDNKHSKKINDFGDGFYLGLTIKQAASWIAHQYKSSIYCFYFKKAKDLKIKTLGANREWLYSILYYRGAFDNQIVPKEIMTIIDSIESSDVIIAPIADNKMYEIINKFIDKEITDEACLHALSMTDLGNQYVLKSMKAIKKLTFIDRLYLCRKEKNDYISIKKATENEIDNKVKISLIEYRRKGQYIDELFK